MRLKLVTISLHKYNGNIFGNQQEDDVDDEQKEYAVITEKIRGDTGLKSIIALYSFIATWVFSLIVTPDNVGIFPVLGASILAYYGRYITLVLMTGTL